MARHSEDSNPTRQTLLERLKNWNDHEGWQQFFDLYWKLIYGMAIKAGLTGAEAQDVVQETAISVAKGIGEFNTDPARGSFKSWLLLITRRRIADQFRKRQRQEQQGRREPRTSTRTPTAERIADPATLDWEAAWNEQWRQNLMDVAMERVKQQASPREWLLFYQQSVKEWSPAKVAKKYHVSRASAYMAKYRIMKLIKKEVRRLEKLEEEIGKKK
jgi:RNA polymerase sigma-70 factor (ECF subfamily)